MLLGELVVAVLVTGGVLLAIVWAAMHLGFLLGDILYRAFSGFRVEHHCPTLARWWRFAVRPDWTARWFR